MPVKIHTKRLELRPYRDEDKDDYLALVTNPEVMRHIEGGEVTEEKAEVWWDRLVRGIYEGGIRLCVRRKNDEAYIGHGLITQTRPEKEFELGFILPKSKWGNGYATEIAKALAEYSRDEMGLERIFGTVDEDHEPSIKVLKKTGMEFFGYDYDDDGRYLVFALKHQGQTS